MSEYSVPCRRRYLFNSTRRAASTAWGRLSGGACSSVGRDAPAQGPPPSYPFRSARSPSHLPCTPRQKVITINCNPDLSLNLALATTTLNKKTFCFVWSDDFRCFFQFTQVKLTLLHTITSETNATRQVDNVEIEFWLIEFYNVCNLFISTWNFCHWDTDKLICTEKSWRCLR